MPIFGCFFSILSVCSFKYSLKCGLENGERNLNMHLKTEFQTNLSWGSGKYIKQHALKYDSSFDVAGAS